MTTDLRLLHLTDPHLFASAQGTLRGVQTLASLQRVLAHAVGRHSNIDALLVTGDIANDEPQAYGHFRRLLGGLGKPVYCIPGNHDDPAQLRSALSVAPFQVGGHIDLAAWRIILLDSCVPGRAGGHLGERELEALELALASCPSDRHALIAVHHHPVGMSSRWLDAVGIDNPDELFAVLDRHAQVRAVVWGHVHQSFDERRKGVRLLATPSTCAQFLPLANEFAVDRRPPGYRRLTLRADGSIETQVVWLEQSEHALTGRSSNVGT